jgi:hypothetical protein
VAWRGRAEQPRRFLGTRSGRKIRSGSLLVDALDLDRVPGRSTLCSRTSEGRLIAPLMVSA